MAAHLQLTPHPLVQRGRSTLTRNRWLAWEPDPRVTPEPLGPEWIWRGLSDVDLMDDAEVLTVLDRVGIVWGHFEDLRDDDTTPAELPYPKRPPVDVDFPTVHMMDVVMYLETLRRIAADWIGHVETGQEMPEESWYALRLGLRPFTMFADVRAAVEPEPVTPVVDLYEAGCWQLAQTILAQPEVRRCANDNCRRVYFRAVPGPRRGWATERSKYCSTSCKNAQLQRAYRARQAAQA